MDRKHTHAGSRQEPQRVNERLLSTLSPRYLKLCSHPPHPCIVEMWAPYIFLGVGIFTNNFPLEDLQHMKSDDDDNTRSSGHIVSLILQFSNFFGSFFAQSRAEDKVQDSLHDCNTGSLSGESDTPMRHISLSGLPSMHAGHPSVSKFSNTPTAKNSTSSLPFLSG